VIRHYDKIVDDKLLGLHISSQNIDKKICHSLGLKERNASGGTSSYEKDSRAS
jgi:hypothetical protein